MYAKIQITGTIEAVTGMHIGGSSAFSAIGAVDSPIIKDRGAGKQKCSLHFLCKPSSANGCKRI